jgi:hypothetical protein
MLVLLAALALTSAFASGWTWGDGTEASYSTAWESPSGWTWGE